MYYIKIVNYGTSLDISNTTIWNLWIHLEGVNWINCKKDELLKLLF